MYIDIFTFKQRLNIFVILLLIYLYKIKKKLNKNKENEINNKDEEKNQLEEDENAEQKPERPVNPNSFIPVMDDMLLTFGQIYYDNKMELIKDNKEVYICTLLDVLFSAGWSSPCRLFYKDLIDIYNKMNDGKSFLK